MNYRIVPKSVAARTGKWVLIMPVIFVVMRVVVATGLGGALHPTSSIEVIDPPTLHPHGAFVERNPGTAIEPDASATERLIAEQYDFVLRCVRVPADTPVKFLLASEDVGRVLPPATNIKTIAMPGFVGEGHTRFAQTGAYAMPCHAFCGLGHNAMGPRVIVVPKERFEAQEPLESTRCAPL